MSFQYLYQYINSYEKTAILDRNTGFAVQSVLGVVQYDMTSNKGQQRQDNTRDQNFNAQNPHISSCLTISVMCIISGWVWLYNTGNKLHNGLLDVSFLNVWCMFFSSKCFKRYQSIQISYRRVAIFNVSWCNPEHVNFSMFGLLHQMIVISLSLHPIVV